MRGIYYLTGLTIFFLGAGLATADQPWRLHIPEEGNTAQRTILVTENQFPEQGKFELTGGIRLGEFDDEDEIISNQGADIFGVALAGRFTPIENLTLGANIPINSISGDAGADGTGFGDIELSLALQAFESALGYPYIIPHLEFDLPTGDEDDGLGTGDFTLRPGITVGTVVFNRWHFMGELTYVYNDNIENAFTFSSGSIYELNNRFGVTGEFSASDAEVGEDDDQAVEAAGGIYYDWSRSLRMKIHGGAGISQGEDVYGLMSFTYNFGLE